MNKTLCCYLSVVVSCVSTAQLHKPQADGCNITTASNVNLYWSLTMPHIPSFRYGAGHRLYIHITADTVNFASVLLHWYGEPNGNSDLNVVLIET